MKGRSRHHIIPSSRGGSNSKENLVVKNSKQHAAYHLLFANALPEEAVLILIKDWFYKNPTLKAKKIKQLIVDLEKR